MSACKGTSSQKFQWPSRHVFQCWIDVCNAFNLERCIGLGTTLLHISSEYNLLSLVQLLRER
jgi:hypothetical protein